MPTRRHCILAAALTLLAFTLPAHAQTTLFAKPLKIVVGFPPGGSADGLARSLAQQLPGLAPAVLVDNKPGAGGRIAIEAVKVAEADGATLVLTPASMVTVYPNIYKKLSYDPVSDLLPLGRIAATAFVVAVGPMVPAEVASLSDFVKWAKANPAKASYGSSGAGSIPHFTGVALGKSLGMEWTHVAYKGAAPAMNDLLGGQIAANISVVSNVLPHIQTGKLRALAISAPERSASLPAVPTFQEAGAKDAAAVEWFGVFAPARTPPEVLARLNQALFLASRSKAYTDAMAKGAFEPMPAEAPAVFAAALKAEIARWGQIVKASGFTPED